jgi:hypothetical protein
MSSEACVTLFDPPAAAPIRSPNPCIALYGPGPEGQTCKGCRHLFAHGHERAYWKCDLRTFSRGRATDHRVGWPACGRFERPLPSA